ncbi:MAG: Na+/H+ antiporter NhaA [Fimbriimonadaceae bacterium]|nr:Na+/H+ antiporter NhaA [Fimbriimonadaceae bacterium]
MRGRRLRRIVRPFQEFFAREASGGVLLIVAALAALLVANSPLGPAYFAWKELPVTLALGPLDFREELIHVVNDLLMATFFFVVGLEIKREILVGELRTWEKASLPVLAAIGGMGVPVLIYLGITRGTGFTHGWGVPTATDIAFALGVLALLGPRVPASARIFLAALAIMDDIGAVLLIAFFYGKGIQPEMLALGGGTLLVMLAFNAIGVRRATPYALGAMVLWAFIYRSGLHPTIAGVLAALTIPAQSRINVPEFLARIQGLVQSFRDCPAGRDVAVLTEDQQAFVEEIERATEAVGTPLQSLLHALHPWVAFGIVPVFAFFNAGVPLGGAGIEAPVAYGVAVGLLLGKPIGVVLFTWLAVRLKIGERPSGLGWAHIAGLGMLAGIGFTMSLFIAGLALPGGSGIESAKIGVLFASATAAVLGATVLLFAKNARTPRSAA